MRKKNFLIFLSLFLGGCIFFYALDPGLLQVRWLGVEIHLSLALAFLIGGMSLYLFKILYSSLLWILKLPVDWFVHVQKLWKTPSLDVDLIRLSKLSLEKHLWEEARSYLRLLLKRAPSPQVYRLLAILELEEKEDEKAAILWLKKALLESSSEDKGEPLIGD